MTGNPEYLRNPIKTTRLVYIHIDQSGGFVTYMYVRAWVSSKGNESDTTLGIG